MRLLNIILVVAFGILATNPMFSQISRSAIIGNNPASNSQNYILLTIFLRHDQSKNIDQIEKELKEKGFYQKFPPEGIEIESWKVVMGIGQVVTLKVPPERLREVNLAIEKMAWGDFRTEFYATYDFLPVYKSFHEAK